MREKFVLSPFLILTILLVLQSVYSGPTTILTPVLASGPGLRVSGNRILDQNGVPVILRGVNIEEQYEMYAIGQHRLNEADVVELVQSWHINVIRVPIMPDLWQYYAPYFQNIIDPIVNWGNKYGIYILLDWHASGNSITGQTSPVSWANSYPFHGNPYNPNITLATNFWNSAAERYKNDPWVIYEIFNEPAYITWVAWRPEVEQLVDVVRSHNPNAMILVSGVNWAYDLSQVKQNPVQRQNIVYNTHPYPGSPQWFGPWDNNFGYLASYYPVFASEWGFQLGDSDPNLNATVQSYGQPLLTYMTQKSMSWTAFCWSTVWDPLMLQSYYVPTQFGALVEQTLDNSTTSTSTTTVITSSSTSSTPTTSTSTSSSTTLPSTTTVITSSSTSSTPTTSTSTSSSTSQTSSATTTMMITSSSTTATASASSSTSSTPTIVTTTSSSTMPTTSPTMTTSSATTRASTVTTPTTTATSPTTTTTTSSPPTQTSVTSTSNTSPITTVTTGSSTTQSSTRSATSATSSSTSIVSAISTTQTTPVTTVFSTVIPATVFMTVTVTPQPVTQTVTKPAVTVTVTAQSSTMSSSMATTRSAVTTPTIRITSSTTTAPTTKTISTTTTTVSGGCRGKWCGNEMQPVSEIPVPEFSGMDIAVFLFLAASLFVLRGKHARYVIG